MVGTVERQVIPGETPVNIPVTLAGGERGIVNKVGYDCNIDYQVSLTNGGIGVGYVGVSTVCPITYNPACCIGDDEEGNPIIKGVLKVNCVIADDLEGADCACFVYQNEFSDNLDIPVALWGTADEKDPYYTMGVAGRYQLSYNPVEGLIKTQCGCFFDRVVVGDTARSLVMNSTAIYGGSGTGPITISTISPGLTNGRCLSIGDTCMVSGLHFLTSCKIGSNVSNYMCFDSDGSHFSYTLNADAGICTRRVENSDEDGGNLYLGATSDISVYGHDTACMWTSAVGQYLELNCINNTAFLYSHNVYINACDYFCLSQVNGDVCSSISMQSGQIVLCGCSGTKIMNGLDVCDDLTVQCYLHACNEKACFCDIGFCDGGWIYCNGESNLACLRLCAPGISATGTWNNNCTVPTASCIRNYLYNRCAVTAYSSGTTLYIRTQACANWT